MDALLRLVTPGPGFITPGGGNRHVSWRVTQPTPRFTCSLMSPDPGCHSTGDLAGFQAAGAHVEPLARAVDGRPHALDVGVEAPLGDLLRPRPVVAEARLLGADVADGSHGSRSWLERLFGSPRRAGNRERISEYRRADESPRPPTTLAAARASRV